MTIAMLRIPDLEAGIQRNRQDDGVALGEWQPPESKGKRGTFLPMEEFKPGAKLAVKIFLEKSKESVTLKLTIKVPEKPDQIAEKTFKDGGKYDLLPKEKKVILYELTEILSNKKAIYIAEIDDKSGGGPVVKTLESSDGYFKFLGKTVSNMANTLLSIPVTISSVLLSGERGFPSFQTLVLADAEGHILDTLTPIEKGTLQPFWLSEEQILFVETHGTVSTLETVSTLKIVKIIISDRSLKFEETPRDLGHKLINVAEPHLAPNQQTIIFRQDSAIISVDLSEKPLVNLIQDKEVTKPLGVFANTNTDSYNLVFSAKEEGRDVYWLAKIQENDVISMDPIPYSYHWELLSKIRIYGERMLYARRDRSRINNAEHVWNIYLSESSTEKGKKITSDAYNDRYPAWSPDGTRIVYASGKIALK